MKSYHLLPIFHLLVIACVGDPPTQEWPPDTYLAVLQHWDLESTESRPFETQFQMLDGGIALYTFRPPQVREWLLFTHGFLDHIGSSSDLIRFLLGRGFGVVAFDLPGHGLSLGRRAYIGSFEEYGDAWARVLRHTQNWGTITALGHSTGSAGFLTAIQRQDVVMPDRVVLIAPLIRSAFWKLSKVAYTALGWLSPNMPARDYATSRDHTWSERWMLDPHTVKVVPFAWVRAFMEWESKTSTWRVLDGSTFHVFQGTADSVVDWTYNVAFLKEKFPGIHIHLIPDGWHGLQYEHVPVKSTFFEKLGKVLAR